MPDAPAQVFISLEKRELDRLALRGLKDILPAICAVLGGSNSERSIVTALLVQEICGGKLMFCSLVDGAYRVANDLGWCAIDLMPDPFASESIVADGTLTDRAALLEEAGPTLPGRFALFRTMVTKYALARNPSLDPKEKDT